jgi:hypothetical protein
LIEYSKTVPAPQPVALIEPATTGVQVLLVIVKDGAEGITQAAPGTVVTELVGLDVAIFTSQLQRVKTVIAVV